MKLVHLVFVSVSAAASMTALGCGSTSSGSPTNENNVSAGGTTSAGGLSSGPTGAGGTSSSTGGATANGGMSAAGSQAMSTGGTMSTGGAGGDATTSYTVQFGPITVPAGVENTQCVVLRLGNMGSIHVGNIHNILGNVSHHMIVYRVSDTTEVTTPFNCQPFTDQLDPTKGSTIMISQKKDDELQLPPGVGYTLDDNQMVRLEMHYINATPDDVTLISTSTMTTVPDSQFTDEANFLFIGDPDIKISPNAKFTLGPVFFKLPSEYAAVNFFAMTGHEHQYGTNVTVNIAGSPSDPGTPVYDVPGWLWSEPKTVAFNPPVQVPTGGGFSFTCDWDNTSSNEITFGESAATNEMCFFWAYYYPANDIGAKVCFHTGLTGGNLDVCCPGDALCSDVEAYLMNH